MKSSKISIRLALGVFAILSSAFAFGLAAEAQEKGTLDPKPLPPLKHPNDPSTPAKQLFGRAIEPAQLSARSIGFYSRGCLAGAKALPVNGATWQVMRVSRDRYWGHPALIGFLERLAARAPSEAGWPGILVGDMSQPRGGPMLTGHASHQIGLDVDIWLTPMLERRLSRGERETISAVNMVRRNGLDVDRSVWSPGQLGIIRAAARDPIVERVFVNAAIKRALCRDATGDRSWLHNVRPYYGHNYHFHVRIACPAGNEECRPQDPVPPGDGCDASLNWWITDAVLHPRLNPHAKPRPSLTMAELPPECRRVLVAK
ncbi:penicillin-insensitive murein endopeptidase [Rhodoblastus acidophilus]|uniref:Penicillin-insensitive murein endopeptidase n=1 Tax=Candidatus Rhodoblastus alkanivorans TaxID=2954117 RepID=A0ABS9Z1D8_9HYPH|nr:penicillin-insensitive murein endopeptidase [Candidatus Rhodoblastus alkanivorans]MCI4679424.1 penicillin-insensitive murein endopeptidase [Candidatus Rhodoblastus alkanivorans]MCI4681432.1 penicillin-insensitive murein endopeptidase [Candidatus Rhodoblastus alkanivorans]MDI4642480.1 penicillin-insensitive murein endopeptidase [Rhodoblastus acidophilus]